MRGIRLAMAVTCVGAALCGARLQAQTGPDVDEIRRNHERAEEARRKDREAARAADDARDRDQLTAATRPAAERIRQLEAEVAARPTPTEVERLRAENQQLRAELSAARAAAAATAAERDALRRRLEEILAAAAAAAGK